MKALQYLLPLALLWVVGAAAAEPPGVSPADAQAEARLEIQAILASPTIGLADLFRLAEMTNPNLALARREVEARAGRLRQVGLYPNPELSLAVDERSVDDPSFHKQKVELSQTLPLGGRRGAAVGAVRAEVDQANEMALGARRAALKRVHRWWADQIHYRELAAALDALTVAAEGTLHIAQMRFEAKAAPESHVTRALLEVYDLGVARLAFATERERSAATARTLFGGMDVPADRLGGGIDKGALPWDWNQADVTGDQARHPALQAARLGIEAAQARLATAQKERIPDLNLFVAYGRARPDDGNFVEGGISFDLPLFDRNQGRVAETTSRLAMAHHAEQIAVHEYDAALIAARSTHRNTQAQLIQLVENITPSAERALDQAQEGYRSGRLMFLELVDAQRTLTDVRLRTLDLRRALVWAEADLMSLLGAGPYADQGDE